MKEEFLNLLRSVKREGIDDLIRFIESTDFFTAPASTRFHGDHAGGLVEHSMKVYEILQEKVKTAPIALNTPPETLIIVPLLHDLCKANFYKIDYRNAKNALGAQKAVTDMTNDMLKKNSELLKQGTIEITEESERAIVDVETLKQTNKDLIETLDKVLEIHENGKAKREEAEKELVSIEQELKDKLLEIKVESGK